MKEIPNVNLYIPGPDNKFTEHLSWKWYCNISIELTSGFLSIEHQDYLEQYYIEAGLLRRWRRPFFRYHYARTLALAVDFLFANPNKKRMILDLGCGTGTQSLAFALLGAKVFSFDIDDMALEILKKRKLFYEQQAGRSLDINVHHTDVFRFDYKEIGLIDGLFSMFAFNMMQPSNKLLSYIIPFMSKEGKIAILDGNNLSWLSIFPWLRRNVLSPDEMESEMIRNGFVVVSHDGGVVLPPPLWFLFPYSLLSDLDIWLGSRSWIFPVSHFLLARRS